MSEQRDLERHQEAVEERRIHDAYLERQAVDAMMDEANAPAPSAPAGDTLAKLPAEELSRRLRVLAGASLSFNPFERDLLSEAAARIAAPQRGGCVKCGDLRIVGVTGDTVPLCRACYEPLKAVIAFVLGASAAPGAEKGTDGNQHAAQAAEATTSATEGEAPSSPDRRSNGEQAAQATGGDASRIAQAVAPGAALRALLRDVREAINPPDRGGISLHEWNGRLKAITARIDAALAALPPEGPATKEHLAFVAVMNALDVHMPPEGRNLLKELREIAATVGYPWSGTPEGGTR